MQLYLRLGKEHVVYQGDHPRSNHLWTEQATYCGIPTKGHALYGTRAAWLNMCQRCEQFRPHLWNEPTQQS